MNAKRTLQSVWTAGLLVVGLAGAVTAHASVTISGTRVVFTAPELETTVKLINEGTLPALTQIWMDKGDPKAVPEAINVPFAVTPSMTRIDPGKGQTLRVLYTGEALPQDKESVFWLNVLEIPPKSNDGPADANKLQLAIRTRIKFFYRPEGLKSTVGEAPAKIAWRLIQNDAHSLLEARNPTPYYVSFSALEVTGNGTKTKAEDGGMVGPGEVKQFPLKGHVTQALGQKLHYQAINDYGGPENGDLPLP